MMKRLLNIILAVAITFTFAAFSGESCSFANEVSQIESGIIQGAKGAGDNLSLVSPQRPKHILTGDATGGGHSRLLLLCIV